MTGTILVISQLIPTSDFHKNTLGYIFLHFFRYCKIIHFMEKLLSSGSEMDTIDKGIERGAINREKYSHWYLEN